MIPVQPGQYRKDPATGEVWRVAGVDSGTVVLRRDNAAWALDARKVAKWPLCSRGGELVSVGGADGAEARWVS